MEKTIVLLLTAALMLSCTACVSQDMTAVNASTVSTEATQASTEATKATEAPTEAPTEAKQKEVVQETLVKDDVPVRVTSSDGLLSLELPNQRWAELHSDAHTLLFSDGDCAISIDLYKNTDTMPSIPLSDETHKLIFTSTVSVNDYVLFITGYAHEQSDFSPISVAINSIRIDKNKVPAAVEKETTASYVIQERNSSAWVTATALNVRSGSGTDKSIIASLPKDTKVTVTGEVMENNRYIGWSRIQMSNGTTGFVASQFLTSVQPKEQPQRTGNTLTLWSEYGTAYTLYEYTDYSWKSDDGTTYWAKGFSTWTNSAGKILYDYDPTAPVPSEDPVKDGSTVQLWDNSGVQYTVYGYTDNIWRSEYGTEFWPDGFSTWKNSLGQTFYDYDPTYVEPVQPEPATPPDDWKETFETSLYNHDGMIACWYTYLGDGWYEVYCQNPNDPNADGTVHVNAYTGGWDWV